MALVLDYLGRPRVIQGRQKKRGGYERQAQTGTTVLTLRTEEGAKSQGRQAASSNWKRQRSRSSPEPAEGYTVLPML